MLPTLWYCSNADPDFDDNKIFTSQDDKDPMCTEIIVKSEIWIAKRGDLICGTQYLVDLDQV